MKIGLLGHGVVGKGVTDIIDGASAPSVEKLTVTKILVKDKSECTDDRCTTEVEDIFNDASIDTICECMGGLEPAHTYVKRALESGRHVVTSNKKMLANYFDELASIAEEQHKSLSFEATAGGGIPWIANLKQIKRIEIPEKFYGIFNGTTNYILYHMMKEDTDFCKTLQKAQQLGYAEQNPSDDILGDDVRFKVMLSSVAAFNVSANPQEIPTWGIANVIKEDFLYAKQHQKVIKLIGYAKNTENYLHAYVLPCFLQEDHYFACIPNNINAIEVISDTLGAAGFVGQGAGSLPTAHAIVQDLISIEEKTSMTLGTAIVSKAIDNSNEKGNFYIRSNDLQPFETVKRQAVNERTIISETISIEDLKERCTRCKDHSLFVAKVGEI